MKKAFIALLLVFSLLISFSACKENKSETQKTEPTSSSSEDGLNNVLDALETYSQTNPDGSSALLPQGDIDSNSDSASEGETIVMPTPIPDGKPVKVPTDDKGFPKKPLYSSYVNKYISDGIYKFSCIYSTTEEELNMSMPFTLAVKGAKSFISMDMTLMQGVSMTTNVITNGKNSYIVLPSTKQYITSSPQNNEDMLGDVSGVISSESGKYVGTTEVTFQNKKYICETYEQDGLTVKCYFLNGKTLDRQEIISGEGNVILTDIKYSDSVEDELFELPEGYQNIDKLAGLLS